jgi:hypothetical protein
MITQPVSHVPSNAGPALSKRHSFKRRILWFAFILSVAAAAVAGYGLGAGMWRLPPGATALLPAALAPLLTRGSPTEGPRRPAPVVLDRYRFELERDEFKQGAALLRVRLVDQQSGALPPEVVIFARRLDMAPEGMPTMTTPLEPTATSGEFRADLTMEGLWQLSLAAKVQGETGTVANKLVFKAVP